MGRKSSPLKQRTSWSRYDHSIIHRSMLVSIGRTGLYSGRHLIRPDSSPDQAHSPHYSYLKPSNCYHQKSCQSLVNRPLFRYGRKESLAGFIRYNVQNCSCSLDLREYQITLPAFWQDQKMVFHRHAVFRCTESQCYCILLGQRSSQHLELHHCEILSQTCATSLRERHEKILHFCSGSIGLHPTFGQETIRVREDCRVALSRIALH